MGSRCLVRGGGASPAGRCGGWLLWICAVLQACLASAAAETNAEPKTGPWPGWVVTNEFAALAPGAFPPGEESRLLLSERQFNVRTDEAFVRVVRQLLNVSGVQNGATLSIDFDPTYEALTLHTVKVWRGTNAIDRLQLDQVSLLRRERDLDRALFDGERSAVLVLGDVRVGDVVEHAYSIRGRNPVYRGRFMGGFSAQLAVPAHRLYTRIVWPSDRRLHLKNHSSALRPQVSTNGGNHEFVWDLRNVPALKPEEDLPRWSDPRPWVQWSEFGTWAEVAEWATGLFADSSALPPALAQKAEEWKALRSTEHRVVAALRYVQDEIRYFGIEIGPGSHQPSSPATVFERRFGDCKDKALLFVAVMRELGIEAYPVLVHSGRGKGIGELHPTANAFDHAIAAVRLGSKVHWVDPTDSYQRGPLAAHHRPDYGLGLVVSPSTKALTAIPPTTAPPETATVESFLVGRPGSATRLRITTTATGGAAEGLRAAFATTPLDTLAKGYLEAQARSFPGINRDAPIGYADDEARNRFTVTESYVIPDAWVRSDRDQKLACEFYPASIGSLLDKPAATARRSPLGLRHPVRRLHRTEIEWPSDIRGQPEQMTVVSPAFRFRKETRINGRKRTTEYEYQSLADAVPAALLETHLRDVTRAIDSLGERMVLE